MTSEKKYYHVTATGNTMPIIMEGLKANEYGEIFLFDNKDIASDIALLQLGLTEYSLFEVEPDGINCKLEQDLVGEFTSRYQWIAKQELIDTDYIQYLGSYKLNDQ